MKFFSFLVTVAALSTVASAAPKSKRGGRAMSKSQRIARRQDPHRMLKRRVAHFAASGPGQGTLQFASLQDAIVAGGDKTRLNLQKKQQTRKIRARQASIFEKRQDDGSNDDDQTGSDASSAANSTSLSFDATLSNGDDADCDDNDDGSDGSSSSSVIHVANAAKKPSSTSASSATPSPSPSPSDNGQGSNDGSNDNNNSGQGSSQSQSGSNSQSSWNNGGNQDSGNNGSGNNNDGSSNSGSDSSGNSGSSSSSSSGGSGQGSGQVHSGGIGTFFTQNGVAGACGTVHQDSDSVVALPTSMYNNGALCGQQVIVTDTSTGKTATATVADECPSCPNPNSLDCSVGLFTQFASEDQGVFNLSWQLAG